MSGDSSIYMPNIIDWILSISKLCLGLDLHSVSVPDQLSLSLQDPKERLGCQVQTGFIDIKAHTFFRNIDWEQVRAD